MDISKNLKAVLFDFDGTITDLNVDYRRLRKELKKFFKRYSLSSDFKPLLPEIRRVSNLLTNSDAIYKKALEIVDKYENEAAEKANLKKGIVDIFRVLKKREVMIIILTRNGRKCVTTFFNKHIKVPKYDFIASRDDVRNLKPNVEHINYILKNMKLSKNDCLLVGDSFHDLALAFNSSVNAIIVSESLTNTYINLSKLFNKNL